MKIRPFLFIFIINISKVLAFSDTQINQLLFEYQNETPNQKIEFYSAKFLSTNQGNGPLGEGQNGEFDRDPLYRFDMFDCTTFIETILGMSVSNDLREFEKNIIEIRYAHSIPNFIERNHFISLDWIPNNSRKGFIKDITSTLFEQFETASTIISKKNWYKNLGYENIQGFDQLSKTELNQKLLTLQSLGDDFTDEYSNIDYISLKNLFKNPSLINKIPSGHIINVVRKNWNIQKSVGTNLLVSHQGLSIRKNGILYYRHATSQGPKKITDTPFKEYFSKYLNSDSSIIGINILEVAR